MVQRSMELKDRIFEVINTKLLESYDKLNQWDERTGPAKVGVNRFPFIKDYKIVKTVSDKRIGWKLVGIERIVPIFRGGINHNMELKEIFGIYNEICELFQEYGKNAFANKAARFTEDLITACLESDNTNLPTPEEITINLKNNVDMFIHFVTVENTHIRSVAPLIGCSFDESIALEKVVFRKPEEEDTSLISMVSDNFYGYRNGNPNVWSIHEDIQKPILIVNHSFKMILNPNDWSVEENMERLHSRFKEICRDVLASIRLNSTKRIGIHKVYHRDSIWTRYNSFRHITEDPSPIYKPVSYGAHLLTRDEFLMPSEIIYKQYVIETFNKIQSIYQMDFFNSFIDGIDHYSKSMEEYEYRWQLLVLLLALESVGPVSNSIVRNTDKEGKLILTNTADKIIHALNITLDSDKSLIRRAYYLRSNAGIAHSGSSQLDQITPRLIGELRNCVRNVILCLLNQVLKS
jgi:hypothetical protein